MHRTITRQGYQLKMAIAPSSVHDLLPDRQLPGFETLFFAMSLDTEVKCYNTRGVILTLNTVIKMSVSIYLTFVELEIL